MVYNWLVTQLDVRETGFVPAPDFCMCINVLQPQNNLSWLPTATSVSALLALRVLPQTQHLLVTPTPHPRGGGSGGHNAGGSSTEGGGASPDAAPQRTPGRAIRNANHNPLFVGETTFTVNVQTRRVTVAISTAGWHPPSSHSEWSNRPVMHLVARPWPILWQL
jgi:hypothetical protein